MCVRIVFFLSFFPSRFRFAGDCFFSFFIFLLQNYYNSFCCFLPLFIIYNLLFCVFFFSYDYIRAYVRMCAFNPMRLFGNAKTALAQQMIFLKKNVCDCFVLFFVFFFFFKRCLERCTAQYEARRMKK